MFESSSRKGCKYNYDIVFLVGISHGHPQRLGPLQPLELYIDIPCFLQIWRVPSRAEHPLDADYPSHFRMRPAMECAPPSEIIQPMR